ncbi:MAG: cupredoxin domain-containing protein [Candidatus Eremiobacteraeota bacterium]|nr:cupredoxin domain-containing protein [Candidatus Eremiobacteraeota bacterium]
MKRSMTRNVFLAAFGMCAIFALTLPAYSQPTVIVHLKDLRFLPDHQVINAGDTVTFVNDDDYAHTVTAADKSFDSGNIAGHASWSHTFARPGTYAYVCTYHLPNMRGELLVKPLAVGEPSASATPSQTATP